MKNSDQRDGAQTSHRKKARRLPQRVSLDRPVTAKGRFSRFGADEILSWYVSKLLDDHDWTAVDMGAGDGVRWSNTYALFTQGWNGLGVEFDSRKFAKLARAYQHLPDVFACRHRISPANIVSLLRSYDINKDFAALSIDLDGNDYWIL